MAKFKEKRKAEKMFFRIKSATVRSEGVALDFVRINRKLLALISLPNKHTTKGGGGYRFYWADTPLASSYENMKLRTHFLRYRLKFPGETEAQCERCWRKIERSNFGIHRSRIKPVFYFNAMSCDTLAIIVCYIAVWLSL